ncbi:hypothetical protein TNCV_896821 [Trichonephila clavipes]|nr:hypothetical protein TNCV_896821 [Trichonephila clavipes]
MQQIYYLASMLPGPQSLGFLLLGPSEIACVRDLEATVEDLTTWIAVTSADIAITPDLFQNVRQSFDIGRAMTISNNALNSCAS